jgi:DNA-binding MarR family transcriptional regulator
MSTTLRELASLDRMIHEPARLMIMTTLYAVAEADFLYLQNASGLTQGNLSSHISKLEETGYVAVEKTFKGKYPLTICRLTTKGRNAFREYARVMQAATQRPAQAKTTRRSLGNGQITKEN